jgi:restriction endonuclease
MGVIVLAGILFLFAVIALAVFARGGAKEPQTTAGMPAPVTPPASGAEMDRVARELLTSRGFKIVRVDPDDGGGPGFVAEDATPVTGQKVYARAFAMEIGQPVTAPMVQAALDASHAEGFNKTLLISPTGFSDEAILGARESAAELIDARRIERG